MTKEGRAAYWQRYKAGMSEYQREKRRASQREYQRSHRAEANARVKEFNERHRDDPARKAKISEYNHRFYMRHREEMLARVKANYQKKKEAKGNAAES